MSLQGFRLLPRSLTWARPPLLTSPTRGFTTNPQLQRGTPIGTRRRRGNGEKEQGRHAASRIVDSNARQSSSSELSGQNADKSPPKPVTALPGRRRADPLQLLYDLQGPDEPHPRPIPVVSHPEILESAAKSLEPEVVLKPPASPQLSHDSPTHVQPEFPTHLSKATLQSTPSEPPAPVQPEDPSLPWYLQTQHTPAKPVVPDHVLERQRIPDLPPFPPPLLPDILSFTSVQLGIDSLSLLDLRALDPPSALGTNLLMLVGTARSIKHLHTSADKLCRWLRRQGIRARPDGWMGPAQRKILLRRRLKKLRAFAHSNQELNMEPDKNSWVCVHARGLEPAEVEEAVQEQTDQSDESRPVIGFGHDVTGKPTLVIHILTEARREEMDLETLWGNKIRRMAIREQKEAKGDFSMGTYDEQEAMVDKGLVG